MKYVIITPAHNEEAYIRFTLDSVVAQTVKPTQWVIVDDGSTDRTRDIVQYYANQFGWIKIFVNQAGEGTREGGSKVVKAFLQGYYALGVVNFDFVAKLDADLTLPNNYFEEVGKAFQSDSTIGLCGGYISELSNGAWKKHKTASYHLRGASKAYRKKCFDQIGRLPVTLNWDFIDEMKAMSLGWSIRILDLQIKHHRRTSTLINRGLHSSFMMGKQYYKDGYDFFLAICRSVTFGLRTKPYIITSIWFMFGFLYNCWARPEKEVDPSLEAFIKKFQYARIRKALLRDKS